MVARWLEKLGQFNFEIGHNAEKDIPHVDFLSRVRTKESGITKFVATLGKSNALVENDTTNPWQVPAETDRKSKETQQKHSQNLCLFAWKTNR